MRRYQVQIADRSFDITVTADGDEFQVDVAGKRRRVSLVKVGPARSHALIDSLSREVDVRKENGEWTVFIDGHMYHAEVIDYHLAELKKTAGVSHAAQMSKELKSPMPGLALKLAVKEGETFKKGDTLLVLEAMKMENLIKATGGGTVKRLAVPEGASVEKGETLIEFE